jgi:hypothetical protein
VFFFVVPEWDGVYFYVRMTSSSPIDTGYYVLEELPTLLLTTLYCQQLLVWAQSYHTATKSIGTYNTTVVRSIWAFNVFAYGTQVLIWVLYDRTQGAIDSDAWSLTASALHAVYFFIIAAALTGYGLGVRRSVRTAPVGLQVRVRQMRAVLVVTATCSFAFLARSTALIAASYEAYTDADGFDEKLTPGDVAGSALFFLLTELLPLVTILRHNSSVPGSRGRGRSSAGGMGSPRAGSAGGSSGSGGGPLRVLRRMFSGSSAGGFLDEGSLSPSTPSTPMSPDSQRRGERQGKRTASMNRGLAIRLGFRPKSADGEEDEAENAPLRGSGSPSGGDESGSGTDSGLLVVSTSGGGSGDAGESSGLVRKGAEKGGRGGRGAGGGYGAVASGELAAARATSAADTR